MNRVSQPPRAVYAAAAEVLAERVVRALNGADDAFRLVDQLGADDEMAGLAAVRVLGPDALAPYIVGVSRFTVEDADVVAAAFAAFPVHESEPNTASPAEAPAPSVPALRDWATGRLLHRLGVDPDADHGAGRHTSQETLWAGCAGAEPGWVAWTGLLTQLAALASPGLDSPVHVQARRRSLDTARGVTRAVLRRDLLSAARLARWLAAAPGPVTGAVRGPAVTALEPEPVLRHLELLGGADPRLHLEIALARAAMAKALRPSNGTGAHEY
jgi:hypothetical protein